MARDPVTRQHRCHVFRCDNPARAVARALLESHQQEKKGGGGGSTVSLATEDSPSRGHAKLVETKEEPRVDGKERGERKGEEDGRGDELKRKQGSNRSGEEEEWRGRGVERRKSGEEGEWRGGGEERSYN